MDPTGEFREKVKHTNLVMANLGRFRFADATPGAGGDFATRQATHRGAAFGDLDDDGRVDAIVTDIRVHFGLGKDETVTKLEVRWPSGALSVLEGVAPDQVLLVKEPEK